MAMTDTARPATANNARTEARAPLPDFVIIGAMKCGTTTLHDQLAAQDSFFMSTPKEPNFFSDDDVFAKGLDWYTSLFETSPLKTIRGESSTHYTKLPTHPHAIDRLAKAVPNAKFVYVMRHPVDRLVSHYIHEWTQNVISVPIDEAIDSHRPLIDYSRYAYQLTPWVERFGKERILPVFFERMTAHPQAELDRIGAFLGAPSGLEWRSNLKASNTSAERIRKFPLYNVIVDNPVASSLRRTLVPEAVRNRVKSNLQMKERPVISEAVMQRLQNIFDEDLASLSQMLGVDLNCACYKDKVTERSVGWI